jgi:hypothetical protein
MNVGLEMWRFSDEINTARRLNAVAARMQPHCPVLYSGNFIMSIHGNQNKFCLRIQLLHLSIGGLPI